MTVRHTLTRTILPAPTGLKAWVVWDDGTLEGPHDVLYASFPVNSYEVQTEVKSNQTHTWLNPGDDLTAAEDDDKFTLVDQTAMFYVDCGIDHGAGMWLEHGQRAFTSQSHAEAAAERRRADKDK